MPCSRRVFAVLVALLLGALPAALADVPSGAPQAAASEAAGLIATELAAGKGEPVSAGAWVRVHYTGWLHDPKAPGGKGTQFDSSVGKEPFVFQLGRQRVIRGWDLGVEGMRAGGKRRLLIPPELGYGARGAGGVIPPQATLLFDIELIDFLPAM